MGIPTSRFAHVSVCFGCRTLLVSFVTLWIASFGLLRIAANHRLLYVIVDRCCTTRYPVQLPYVCFAPLSNLQHPLRIPLFLVIETNIVPIGELLSLFLLGDVDEAPLLNSRLCLHCAPNSLLLYVLLDGTKILL